MHATTNALPDTLKQVRKARRLSQLQLSLRVGVSQRHVSFVESGRARPSRELLIAWLRALDTPLTLRNSALLQAGYAPLYSAAPLDDPALAQAKDALIRLLSAHDPMPAFVIDAQWNLLHINRGGQWLAATLAPIALEASPTDTLPNMLDLMLHPDGFAKSITNLHEIGPALLAKLREEAVAQPILAPHAEAFERLLRAKLGRRLAVVASDRLGAPMLTTRFATQYGELAFFSMFTTFGTPHDITLASLRVEHLFAAGDATLAVLQSHVG